MEDPGPTIIEALERDGFIVLQSYDDRSDTWTVSAAHLQSIPELRYSATASAPTPAVIEVATQAGYLRPTS
jgi:hypothetical protein